MLGKSKLVSVTLNWHIIEYMILIYNIHIGGILDDVESRLAALEVDLEPQLQDSKVDSKALKKNSLV